MVVVIRSPCTKVPGSGVACAPLNAAATSSSSCGGKEGRSVVRFIFGSFTIVLNVLFVFFTVLLPPACCLFLWISLCERNGRKNIYINYIYD